MLKKNILILILGVLLAGCCTLAKELGMLTESVATMVREELVEDNGWALHTPPEGWLHRWKLELLPEYFDGRFPVEPFDTPNHFGAVYELPSGQHLAVAVGTETFPYHSKAQRGEGECVKEWEYDYTSRCINSTEQVVNISINNADIEFDNTSVAFIFNKTKLQGEEISRRYYWASNRLEPALYDISLDTTTETTGASIKPSSYHRCHKGRTIFHFLFEPMACRDLENAVFLIDGFYHQGKRLPPLQVRIRYIDLEQIPEYKGEVGEQITPPSPQ